MSECKQVTIAAATAARPRSDHSSIVELRDGRLMIAYIEFCGGEDLIGHDHAPSNIVTMISSDGGRTWGERRVLVETNPGDCNVYKPNFLRLNSGEILFYCLRMHQLKEGEVFKSSSFICRSTDEGQTFSEPTSPDALRDIGDCNTLVLLSSGSFGKGRVVCLTGTLHGAPAAGMQLFYDWSGWPRLIRNTLQWLAKPSK